MTEPKNKKAKTDKSGAVAKKRSKKAEKAAQERAEKQALANAEQAAAQRLAQIVNLIIGGHSFASIGAAIGSSAEEVEQMLQRDAGRYVRTQPALRTYVRNFISEKYTGLLDAVYTEATTTGHAQKLEHQDRALRILKEMAKLHGAEAPTQSEVTVEASPEAVEKLVAKFAAQQGVGYDVDVFDAEIVEDVHEAHDEAVLALEESSAAVEVETEQDEPLEP